MNQPTFVIMGNYKYYHMLETNIIQILKVYNQSNIIVYDWGDKEYRQNFVFDSPNVTVINWSESIKDTRQLESSLDRNQQLDLALRYNARFERTFLQRLKKKLLKSWPGSPLTKPLIKSSLVFENMLMQKIPCLIDASARIQSGPMIFLDADAFILKNVDDVLGRDDFDVAITLSADPCFQVNHCSVINSGVIFFGPSAKKRGAFLNAWRQASLVCAEWLREQTSMVRMLEATDAMVFRDQSVNTVNLMGESLAVLTLPQRIYNNTDHNSLGDPVTPCIVHFANTAQNDRYFKKLQAELARIK